MWAWSDTVSHGVTAAPHLAAAPSSVTEAQCGAVQRNEVQRDEMERNEMERA